MNVYRTAVPLVHPIDVHCQYLRFMTQPNAHHSWFSQLTGSTLHSTSVMHSSGFTVDLAIIQTALKSLILYPTPWLQLPVFQSSNSLTSNICVLRVIDISSSLISSIFFSNKHLPNFFHSFSFFLDSMKIHGIIVCKWSQIPVTKSSHNTISKTNRNRINLAVFSASNTWVLSFAR